MSDERRSIIESEGNKKIAERKPTALPSGNADAADAKSARELGGRDGPDPTRFGDWEKNGRCVDF